MGSMEGWLYLIESNRLMMTYPRKRYFVICGNRACFWKDKPANREEAPIKSGTIDPYTRVTDHGREIIHGRRTLFVFTIYDSYNHEDKLKFGARSSEEAAKWMEAFKEAAEQAHLPGKDRPFVPAGGRRRYPFRLSGRRGSGLVRDNSGGSALGNNHLFREDSTTLADLPGWIGSLLPKDASPDVVADSPWQIFGCQNGLRLFRETTDHHGLKSMIRGKIRGEDPPALMAVGVVHATCESVFETVMALGPSRAEWDFCYLKGRVIEHIDGHSDIVHKQFHKYWLPWRMKPRDLLVHRYWRREDDGSYVILYTSVNHEKCPPRKKFVRAWLKSGGYVISPLPPQGGYPNRCMVKHILTVDWKDWNAFWSPCRDKEITLKVLERVAALREFCTVKPADDMSTSMGPDLRRLKVAAGCPLVVSKKDTIPPVLLNGDPPAHLAEDKVGQSMFRQLAEDEFFDVPEDSVWDLELEPDGQQHTDLEGTSDEDQNGGTPKLSAAATIVKRFQGMTAQKRTHQDSGVQDDIDLLAKVGTLPKSSSNSCTVSTTHSAEASTFLIRGKRYLQDRKKVVAQDPVMQFVAADWLKSNKREDNLSARPNNPVQLFLANQRKKEGRVEDAFFFVINIQVPGSTTHSLALYYMITQPLSDFPLLQNFVHGDDRYRNAGFKLIPHIAKGSWIVKQSVGKTACLIGEALEITYHTDKHYIELDVDIGSSSVAKGVVNLVLGYLSTLVIELAFLIQANTEEELPEYLLGTCRLVNLDVAKAIPARPE